MARPSPSARRERKLILSPRVRQSIVEVLESRRLLSATDVLTFHNDNGRTGQYLSETQLTTQNVDSTTFGQLFSDPVDGQVYAQPLYMGNLTIPGKGIHNVIFVATEHDSVYAFDANNNSGANSTPLWHDSFINPAAGVTTLSSNDVFTPDITPEIGITGTPVIDGSTGTLYVVSNTKTTSANGSVSYAQQLHALDVTTGAEKFGGPAMINFSTPGGGGGSVNGVETFNPLIYNQRPGLALNNGSVYVAWASHGDNGDYHGAIAAYSASTLQLQSVLNVTPNGYEGGIWMSGSAPAIDSQGNIFLETGNGTFDNGGSDYGDSLLKISTAGNLSVVDSFTPFNQAALGGADLDVGSGGVTLIPTQAGSTVPNIAVGGAKDGNLYVVNQAALGGFGGSANTNLQTVQVGTNGSGLYDTAAYFNGNVYVHAQGGGLQSYGVVNGQLVLNGSVSASFAFPGDTPSVSANGSSNGIVWEIEYGNTAVLHAYEAANISNELYNSNQAGTRDALPLGVKFAVPTVANGHVYVGTSNAVVGFGLLGQPPAIIPTAPTAVAASAVSSTDVHVSWQQNSTDVTTFLLFRSTDGINFSRIGAASGSSSSFDDLTAAVGTTYTYYVVAENAAGNSPNSATASATTPAVSGLVGYWQFNEGTGTSTSDASGNNDTGTLNGEVTWLAGRIGPGSLNFHGAGVRDAHVGIPDAPQLRFSATNSFSVGVWVYATAPEGKWTGIVTKSSDVSPGYGLYLDPTNHWAFATSSGVNEIQGPVADANWHYLTLVQDGAAGTRQLWVDGALANSGPAEDASGTGELWVGGTKASIEQYFKGAVDDLRIYNVALTATQIASLAQVPGTPTAGNNSISGTVFHDNNANGVQETTETGADGITVFLDVAGTGTLASNDPVQITDSGGRYSFSGLPDGSYKVIAVPADQQRITTPAAGSATVAVAGGQVVQSVKFGEAPIATDPAPSQFALRLLSKLPAHVIGGTRQTITLRVTNSSTTLLNAPIQLVLFASTKSVLDNHAYGVMTPLYRNVKLKPGRSEDFRLTFTYPANAPAGSYYLLSSVTVEKSNGNDQTVLVSPTQVAVAPPVVSLTPMITNSRGVLVRPGKRATASVRIFNSGNSTAAGILNLSLFASADGAVDASDTLLKAISRRIRIAPNSSSVFSISFVAPTTLTPGAYNIVAQSTSSTSPPDNHQGGVTAVAVTRGK